MKYTGALGFFDIIHYFCHMEVPKEVATAAASLVEMYGNKFARLGEKDGWTVYQFVFPKSDKTGFPFVYLYKEGEPVKQVTGMRAVKIVTAQND